MRRVATNEEKREEKYGVIIPKGIREALRFDEQSKGREWAGAAEKDVANMRKYEVFEVLDGSIKEPPEGYQFAKLQWVFDVKPGGRRKGRLVIGGHMVDTDNIACYAPVVKTESVRMIQAIAQKNGLGVVTGDVSSAYLNAKARELIWTKAGPEFGNDEGKIILIRRALYGLRSSAAAWAQHLSGTLRSMGFKPSRADRMVGMKIADGEISYILVHTDDFLVAAKRLERFVEQLRNTYALKDVESEGSRYLGADHFRGDDGSLRVGSKTYVTEAISKVQRLYGKQLKNRHTPLPPGDRPELDETELCPPDQIQEYRGMIGMLNWAVSLGRMDVAFATQALSSFSASPTIGHLKRVWGVFGYLKRYPDKEIVVDGSDPENDFGESSGDVEVEELKTQYPDAVEQMDEKAPEAIYEEMATSIYVDADNGGDQVDRRSVSGILVMLEKTPVIWRSKKQPGVETSTYGSEFYAMKLAAEMAEEIRYKLRSFGIKVEKPTRVYGDNLGVIQSVSREDAALKKKHI